VTCSAQQQPQAVSISEAATTTTPTTPRRRSNGITIPKLAHKQQRQQQQQQSLADRMVQLQIENHDFGRRMMRTMQEQHHRSTQPLRQDWFFLARSILGIVSIFTLASFINTGRWMGNSNDDPPFGMVATGLWIDLQRAISTACLALGFQWILRSSRMIPSVILRGNSDGSSSSSVLSLLATKALSNQWTFFWLTTIFGNSNPHSYYYYVRHVVSVIVPNMFHAVRSMVVAEAWNQFFLRFYKSLSRVLLSSSSTTHWELGTPINPSKFFEHRQW
jgi:hypothetical protein